MPKRIDILFIMHMPPPVHGAAMMGQYIHDSAIINDKIDCHYINLMTAKNINDIGKWRIGKFFSFITILLHIIKQVKSIKPELVYVTPNACGAAFYKDFIILQLLKLLHCKIVVHYHNKGVATRQNRAFDNLLYKKFFKNIKVILLASCLHEDIKKYIARKNVYICPNGIPQQSVLPKTQHQGFNILFLSNMMEEKGVYTLLDACMILNDKGIDFHCHFVGKWSDITDADFKKYVANAGISDMVTAYGARYGDEKKDFIPLADVFVFPTYYHNECLPLVLLEAMQQKITCIASDEGGIPSIIDDGKTGFIVPKKDAQAIADKIEYLINHPDVNKQMGNEGYKKYCEKYTLDVFEKKLAEILLDVSSQQSQL